MRNRILKNFTVVFFVLLITSNLYCFDIDTIQFEHLSLKEGLSQSIVGCIFQDKKGFMWFGTEDGLNKYDGYSFTILRQDPANPNGLSHNYVTSIYEDRRGMIWIGTFHGGVNKYDPATGRFHHYKHNPNNPGSLSNNIVHTIYEDRSGTLWLGTEDGLNRFDRTAETFHSYRHAPDSPGCISHNRVQAICEDISGNLWIGTYGGGLNKFLPENGKFKSYRAKPDSPGNLNCDNIRVLFPDRSGSLWIGTIGGGLNRFLPETESFTDYYKENPPPGCIRDKEIYAIFEDSLGRFWLGTSGGLYKMDRKTGKCVHYLADIKDPNSLSYNGIRAIFEDKSGVIWIGTYGGGINKFDGKKKKFPHFYARPNDPNSLSHNIVWSIYEDNEGILWIGTHGGGLNKFDRINNRFTHFRANPQKAGCLSSDIVRLVYGDLEGILWIGTNGGGLNKFDPKSETFTVYRHDPRNPSSISHNELRAIYEDSRGNLWIGTNGGGLNNFDRKNNRFIHYRNDPKNPNSLSNDYVRCIVEDRSGNLWIGTQGGGLNKFDRESASFSHYRNNPEISNSLSNDFVFAFCEDSDGKFWIGTWGGGLNLFNRDNGTFSHIGMADGLANDSIYGILEDNNKNLWISTNNGLSKYNIISKGFKNYKAKDGLQSNEFNGGTYFKSKNGEMFFGGINGFNAFFPENIKESQYIPPIVITSFKLKNKEKKLPKPISEITDLTLSYKDYFFSFEFAALDYTAPRKNKYSYTMKGLDDQWIQTDSSKRFASYTTLEPGKYTFMVKGSNSDGKWNEEAAAINITIIPHFSQTVGFKIFLGLLGVLLVIYLHRLRTSRIREEMEKERLEKELRLKADFTAMLVHDLRSPLTAVMGYSDMLKTNAAQLNLEKVGNVLYRTSNKMLNLINEMLDVSKFEAGKMTLDKKEVSLQLLIQENIELMNPLFKKKNLTIQCNIAPEITGRKIIIDSEKISEVLTNLLSNAEKFSPTDGTVTIDAHKTGKGFIEVAVTDNGPGVRKEQQKYLFNKYAQLAGSQTKGTGLGLAVSKFIIESHGGTIGYKPPKKGTGSIFYFQLPAKSS